MDSTLSPSSAAEAKNADPTLLFKGGSSDAALNAKIQSDFDNCGWFDVLKSGKAIVTVTIDVMGKNHLRGVISKLSDINGIEEIKRL